MTGQTTDTARNVVSRIEFGPSDLFYSQHTMRLPVHDLGFHWAHENRVCLRVSWESNGVLFVADDLHRQCALLSTGIPLQRVRDAFEIANRGWQLAPLNDLLAALR